MGFKGKSSTISRRRSMGIFCSGIPESFAEEWFMKTCPAFLILHQSFGIFGLVCPEIDV